MKTLPLLSLLLVSLAVGPLRAAEVSIPPLPNAAEAMAVGFGPTIAADAKVTKLAGGFKFTEGATTAANGDVYFIDQDNNRIHKWSITDNKVSIFLEPSNRANGQYFDSKGTLVSCCDEKNELWSIAPDGSHTVLISSAGFEGHPLDGPNDVWIRPDGGLYVTDPCYIRSWWDPSVKRPAQPVRAVYYLSPDHQELKRVAQDFAMPNGIAGTPDGKTLYVADIDGNKTFGFDIQPDGSLTNRRLICNLGSDGMTIDNQGHLYMSAASRGLNQGLSVVEISTGKLVGFVPMPEQPANMAFGGKNHDTLYLTARTGFYMLPTKVKGGNAAK